MALLPSTISIVLYFASCSRQRDHWQIQHDLSHQQTGMHESLCVHACIYLCMHQRMYSHAHNYVGMHSCMYVCTNVCLQVGVVMQQYIQLNHSFRTISLKLQEVTVLDWIQTVSTSRRVRIG